MKEKQVLCYGFADQEEILFAVLRTLGITPVPVTADRLSQQVGFLCGLPGYREKNRPLSGEAPREALMLFHNLPREDLNDVLRSIRQGGVTRSSLKAMVTPTNSNWTLETLLGELRLEQEVMGELMKLNRLRREITPDPMNFGLMQALVRAEKCFSGGEEVTADTIRQAYAELSRYQK